MAISYVGGQTAFILGSTTADTTVTFSLTGGTDSAPATDDLVVVCVAASRFGTAGVTSLVTTGYTSTTRLTAEDAQDSASQVHYKFMGGTPDTEVVITRSGATDSGQAYTIHVFRGVDLTTPLDVTTTTATGIDTGRPDPAAITPSTAGTWIYIGTGGAAATGATFTYGDFTAVLSTVCDETSNDAVVGSGYFAGWTSGAYDPAASTTGSTSLNSSWTATTMAFRPAAGGSTWSSTSTASATLTGTSIAASALNSSALASVTWGGASIASNAWSSTASSAAFGGVVGASIDAQDWRSVARLGFPPSANRWSGEAVAADSWSITVAATITWGGAEVVSPFTPSNWGPTATASFTGVGATIAEAGFEMVATATITIAGEDATPAVAPNLDGWKPRHQQEEIEEEDLMFLVAAVHTYTEHNNVYH